MSDELLIRHCAPTLAGMKTGSLFTYEPAPEENLRTEICRLNRMLTRKGLRVLPLSACKARVMIYVYRPGKLREDFSSAEIRRMLEQQGYQAAMPDQCVTRLMRKLREQEDFPHEIGLFLGYPPEDVAGFMEHRTCGCKCVGCWKVYGDVQKAQALFARYKRCTSSYLRAYHSGRGLEQLAV